MRSTSAPRRCHLSWPARCPEMRARKTASSSIRRAWMTESTPPTTPWAVNGGGPAPERVCARPSSTAAARPQARWRRRSNSSCPARGRLDDAQAREVRFGVQLLQQQRERAAYALPPRPLRFERGSDAPRETLHRLVEGRQAGSLRDLRTTRRTCVARHRGLLAHPSYRRCLQTTGGGHFAERQQQTPTLHLGDVAPLAGDLDRAGLLIRAHAPPRSDSIAHTAYLPFPRLLCLPACLLGSSLSSWPCAWCSR